MIEDFFICHLVVHLELRISANFRIRNSPDGILRGFGVSWHCPFNLLSEWGRGGGGTWYTPERLERGGLCWLLKLRWIGTQRGQMKGVLSWLVRWACRAGTIGFCSAALVGPVQNFYFLTVHYFNAFVPIVRQAGQAAMLGRLSLGVCLWHTPQCTVIVSLNKPTISNR
jgi:hypothetical protein